MDELDQAGKKKNRTIKVVIFLAVAAAVFACFCYVAKPMWRQTTFNMTVHGFYDEPEDSIETLVLGTSSVYRGIIPMELYEDYGISAYNLGTSAQPMMASYYWLEEAYRFQSESLDTVVLDMSSVFSSLNKSKYRSSIEGMRMSTVKFRAIRAYSDGWGDTLLRLVPLLSYHSRWEALEEEDFLKGTYDSLLYSRGYYFWTDRYLDRVDDYSTVPLPLYEADEEAGEAECNANSLSYFEAIVDFCKEHDIQLVLIKTPVNWTSVKHNAVQALAAKYDLPFLDFNVEPYYSEIEYNRATDNRDSGHANYYGASKLTHYLGNYLMEECGNQDVRGDADYAFLEEELGEYHKSIVSVDLIEQTDPCDYLSYLVGLDGYMTFLSVKNDAATALTEEQREYFSSIGLTGLAEIASKDSYLAVLDDGGVIEERLDPNPDEGSGKSISYRDMLSDWTEYTVTSGGANLGNVSSVVIDDTEYSPNQNGLNIVVYDKRTRTVVDAVTFPTGTASQIPSRNYRENLAEFLENGGAFQELSGQERQLYLYDRACAYQKRKAENSQMTKADGLLSLLQTVMDSGEYTIYLAVQEDGAESLTDEVREALRDMGLTRLASLESGDSYLAVVSGNTVLSEERDHGASPVKEVVGDVTLVSGGEKAGNTVSIKIDGEEYAKEKRGINLVICDTVTGQVVDSLVFDTHTTTPALP